MGRKPPHHLCCLYILKPVKSHNPADTALALYQSPGEAANHYSLIGKLVNVPAHALCMDCLIRLAEQLNMHCLVMLRPRIYLI